MFGAMLNISMLSLLACLLYLSAAELVAIARPAPFLFCAHAYSRSRSPYHTRSVVPVGVHSRNRAQGYDEE